MMIMSLSYYLASVLLAAQPVTADGVGDRAGAALEAAAQGQESKPSFLRLFRDDRSFDEGRYSMFVGGEGGGSNHEVVFQDEYATGQYVDVPVSDAVLRSSGHTGKESTVLFWRTSWRRRGVWRFRGPLGEMPDGGRSVELSRFTHVDDWRSDQLEIRCDLPDCEPEDALVLRVTLDGVMDVVDARFGAAVRHTLRRPIGPDDQLKIRIEAMHGKGIANGLWSFSGRPQLMEHDGKRLLFVNMSAFSYKSAGLLRSMRP